MGRTLLDKIWDAHTVRTEDGGRSVLYIDRQYIHEVTSPVAFAGLERRGIGVARPAQITATADHNIPTVDQHLPIAEAESRRQVEALEANCAKFGIEHFGVGNPRQGIVHIIDPELGFTQPGMTIVCGDSHTSTHGALGAVAFGVGTSEVEMVFASQCIIQSKPRSMRITVDGTLRPGVEAKDVVLYIISQLTASGGTGYFIEFAGEAIRSLSMEGRMTVCNMSIECGARGGMIAPDRTTFDYLRGRERAPQGAAFDQAVARWEALYSDADAVFDKEYRFDAADIAPDYLRHQPPAWAWPSMRRSRPGRPQGIGVHGIQSPGRKSCSANLSTYVFVGSCTKTAHRKTCGASPSWSKAGARPGRDGMDRPPRFEKASKPPTFWAEGARQSARRHRVSSSGSRAARRAAMNADPAGKYSLSTSNRNFRRAPRAVRAPMLAGIAVAAAAAVMRQDRGSHRGV